MTTDLHDKSSSLVESQENIERDSTESINQSRQISAPQILTFHRQSQGHFKKLYESIPHNVRIRL